MNIFGYTVEISHVSVNSVPRSFPQMLDSCTHSHDMEYTVEINHISVNSVPRSLPQMLDLCTYSHDADDIAAPSSNSIRQNRTDQDPAVRHELTEHINTSTTNNTLSITLLTDGQTNIHTIEHPQWMLCF